MNRLKIFAGALAMTLTAALPAAAQLRLPAQHNSQHKYLLANQRPFSLDSRQAAARDLQRRVEAREAEADIFGQYWESERVNPYGNIDIPATKQIDVRNFVMPVEGEITSPYGWRPQFGRMHRGVDLRLAVGDTVCAAFSGKVRLTKYEGKGYGYYVVVRHDNGLETVYGHLSRFLVKPNQRVRAGQPIALGGNTGRSTGPHLHFETRYLGLAINPEAIIDFSNNVTHRDFFAFNKSTYERSQHHGPRTLASAKKHQLKASKATKSKKGAKGSSKKRKRRR